VLDVLEIPEVRERVVPVTVDRYHRMIELGFFEERPVELINGVIVEKMSKSELHLYLVDLLRELLQDHCAGTGFWVRKEDPITLANSEPEPDLSVVPGSRGEYRHAKPTTARFIIEVAIHSLALDRAKTREYAKAGVPEVWIVQPEAGITEVSRHPVDGGYTERLDVPADTTLESTALPGFAFRLGEALAE
jgi:Uma2 family endonuclease